MEFVDAQGYTYEPTSWLTFNDVLLRPRRSRFKSRNDKTISLKTHLGSEQYLDLPIISANMDTVTGTAMAIEMSQIGGLGILHRFYPSLSDYAAAIHEVAKIRMRIGFSVGCGETWVRFVNDINDDFHESLAKELIVCLDVAHGHMEQAMDTVRELRKLSNIFIIAGNVATPEGAVDLVDCGADCIKVGVGCGSVCTTRLVTGHGIPQLSAIMNVKKALVDKGGRTGIIADGGIRNSGDIVKALAAGADAVMIGNMLSGCDETPGEPIRTREGSFKLYRGQSSRHFLNDLGKVGVAAEGEAIEIKTKGPVRPIIEELCGGIRSGFTYSGVGSIAELQDTATCIEIGHHAWVESTPHALRSQ